MKNNKYYDVLLKKILNETLEDKAKEVMEKLNFKPGKSFDYVEEGQMCEECGGYKGGEFMEGQMCECGTMYEEMNMCEECGGYKGGEFMEGQMCECGYKGSSEMLEMDDREFEIDKKYRYNPKKFDKLNLGKNKEMTYKGRTNYPQGGSQHHIFQDDNKGGALIPDEDIIDFDDIDIEELTERLFGKQKNIDKNHNGKIDAEDFKMLRNKKHNSEIDERLYGNQSKIDKNKNGRIDAEDFKMLRKESDEKFIQKATSKMDKKGTEGKFGSWCKKHGLASDEGEVTKKCIDKAMKSDDSSVVKMANFAKNIGGFHGAKHKKTVKESNEVYYRLQNGNDSEIFTESEIVDMIEQIVMEEKSNIKKGITPAGLAAYEKAHKGSGKENEEYMKEFTKKITEYEKDGSKEKFTTEPKHFPKGNGELEKMNKKAYVMSNDGKEFLDDYMHPGMEDIVPEEITYDEDWVSDNIKGSSRTGNNPEWANAEKTDLGDKISKKQKAKKFHKAKEMAYRKSKQPVTDGTGENSGSGVNIKLESVVDKKAQKLNEEFNRMKSLMGYNQKTQ